MKIKNPKMVAYINDLYDSLQFSTLIPINYSQNEQEDEKTSGSMRFKLINKMRSPERTEFNLALAINADMEMFGLEASPEDSPNLVVPDFYNDLGLDEVSFDQQEPNDFFKMVIATTKMVMSHYPELKTTSNFTDDDIELISNFIVVGSGDAVK